MRALLAALLLTTLAFAGCAGGDGDGDQDADDDASSSTSGSGSATTSKSSTKSGSGTGSSSQTGTGAPANRPPSLVITLAAGQSANGSAPLAVTFLLNGTDPDGDALTWTLDHGDGSANATGTTLPATSNHTYEAEGAYNATFEVTDGEASVNATYAIVVAAGSGGGLPPIVITGSWLIGAPEGNSYEFGQCEAGPADGITTAAFDIPAEAAGRTFVATIASATDTVQEWVVALSNTACGTGDDEYEDFAVDGDGPITGTILDGWTFGSFASVGGNDLEVTMTIT